MHREQRLFNAAMLILPKAQWDAEIASGQMDSSKYPELGYTACENGFAAAIPGDFNNTFKCNNASSPYNYLVHMLTCLD